MDNDQSGRLAWRTRSYKGPSLGWFDDLPREILTANTTFFVRVDGDDNNDGRTNSASKPGGAFLTLQGAYNSIAARFDLATFNATLSIQPGTYTTGLTVGRLFGQTKTGQFTITGPSTAIISTSTGRACITTDSTGCMGQLKGGITLINSVGGLVRVGDNSYFELYDVNYGSAGPQHISCDTSSHLFLGGANYIISGSAASHIVASGNANIEFFGPVTVTIQNTPAFSGGFVSVFDAGCIQSGNVTFSGACTGPRWQLQTGGIIDDSGSWLSSSGSYWPGNSAGVISGAGQYDDVIFNGSFQKSGAPANTDIPAGTWALFKDTSGGGVVLAYNDAGTIKKVTLT